MELGCPEVEQQLVHARPRGHLQPGPGRDRGHAGGDVDDGERVWVGRELVRVLHGLGHEPLPHRVVPGVHPELGHGVHDPAPVLDRRGQGDHPGDLLRVEVLHTLAELEEVRVRVVHPEVDEVLRVNAVEGLRREHPEGRRQLHQAVREAIPHHQPGRLHDPVVPGVPVVPELVLLHLLLVVTLRLRLRDQDLIMSQTLLLCFGMS